MEWGQDTAFTDKHNDFSHRGQGGFLESSLPSHPSQGVGSSQDSQCYNKLPRFICSRLKVTEVYFLLVLRVHYSRHYYIYYIHYLGR